MAESVKPRRLNAEVLVGIPQCTFFLSIFFEHFLFSLLIIHDVTKRLLSGLKGVHEN